MTFLLAFAEANRSKAGHEFPTCVDFTNRNIQVFFSTLFDYANLVRSTEIFGEPMFGTLISNDLLVRRIADGSISIKPFSRELAQMAHYPLELLTVFRKTGKEWKQSHDFNKDGAVFRLMANEYVVVEVAQQIKLKQGFAGSFVPASNLIEQGLGLVAGKITAPFGSNGEKIRFGVKNYLDEANELGKNQGVAYVQFFDLSALPASEYVLTRRDLDIYTKRRHDRADDDSVYSIEPVEDDNNF